MNLILGKIYALSGGIYIPKDVKTEEPLILHISDTPSSLYTPLQRLIKKIKPAYIVHTGNFTDHLKIAEDQHLKNYTRSTKRFIDILEASDARAVYGVFGNYDIPEVLMAHARTIRWIHDFADITIENLQLRISHDPKYALSAEADFSLFGHNLEILSYISDDAVYLNGFEAIHIISTISRKISHIEYPMGTSDTRQPSIHINL